MEEVVIEGVVCQGRRLGRELGFPTANVELAGEVELADGVYLSCVEWRGEAYRAISNLGTNPTVGGNRRRLESHLLDYKGEPLYGERLRITLLDALRQEMAFESIEALRHQIERDVERARELFAKGAYKQNEKSIQKR